MRHALQEGFWQMLLQRFTLQLSVHLTAQTAVRVMSLMGSDLCTVLAWLRACRPVPAQSSELGPHCRKQVAPLIPCRESADAQRREPPAQHGILPVGLKKLAWIQPLPCVSEQSGHARLCLQMGQETTSCAATVQSSRA